MALFGYADGRRGRAGYIRQLSGRLDLAEGDLGLGVEVDSELPQLVPGQLVEGLEEKNLLILLNGRLFTNTKCNHSQCYKAPIFVMF